MILRDMIEGVKRIYNQDIALRKSVKKICRGLLFLSQHLLQNLVFLYLS